MITNGKNNPGLLNEYLLTDKNTFYTDNKWKNGRGIFKF